MKSVAFIITVISLILASFISPVFAFMPNDTDFDGQWDMKKIKVDKAWDITIGSSTDRIAIIDSGLDLTHPDLSKYISWKWNAKTLRDDVQDTNGHGTQVTGIIGAVTNNHLGISGIVWLPTLIVIKDVDSPGERVEDMNKTDASGNKLGPTNSVWRTSNGIRQAVDAGAKVINMSLGFYSECASEEMKPMYDAIDYAKQKNVVLVVSAGNDNYDARAKTPASCSQYFDNVITVGATDDNDRRGMWLDGGGASNFGNDVVISAPGVGIITTTLDKNYTYGGGATGTSFATPHVTGTVALLIAKYPNLDASKIKRCLVDGADEITTDQPLGSAIPSGNYYISKRLNVEKALLSCGAASSSHPSSPFQTPVNSAPPAGNNLAYIIFEGPNGGGRDILGFNDFYPVVLLKDGKCTNANFTEASVRFKKSNSSTEERKIIRFKVNRVCNNAQNAVGELETPDSISHECLNNNTLARIKWTGNAPKYEIRAQGANGESVGANVTNECNGAHPVCNNSYTQKTIDLVVNPNTKYNFWLNGVRKNANGSIERSGVANFNGFQCPVLPTGLKASCNRTTLALSWDKVPGVETYQMRGGKIKDGYTDYTPSSYKKDANGKVGAWYDLDPEIDNKQTITNSTGTREDGVQCTPGEGGKCSYFQSGLTENSKYKLWVNTVTSAGKLSNAYFPGLVQCKNENFSAGGWGAEYTPTNATATCDGQKLKVSVTSPKTGMKFHIRGYKVDDLPENQKALYYPPNNWTDGVPENKKIALNTPVATGNSYITEDIPVAEPGEYRVWVTAFQDSEHKSDNFYIPGVVKCTTGTSGGSGPVGGTAPAPMIFIRGQQLLTTGNEVQLGLSPDGSNNATLEVQINGVTRVINFKVNRPAPTASAGPALSESVVVNGKTIFKSSSNEEIKITCQDPSSDGRVFILVETKDISSNKSFKLDEAFPSYNDCQNRTNPCQSESCTTEGDFCWNINSGRRYLVKKDVNYQLWYSDVAKVSFNCASAAVRTSNASTFAEDTNDLRILSSTCTGAQATVTWSGSFDKYDLRFDNQKDSWTGTCSSTEGDFCVNGYTSGNSYTFDAKSGKYDWWLQGFKGDTGSEVPHGSFTCQGS